VPNYSRGKFTPKNPEKYVGRGTPTWRSSWELAFMTFADNNQHILSWASESIRIPYVNPITGKGSIYVPDFFITYQDKAGTTHAEVIEIKPKKQSLIESKASSRDRAVVAVNYAKWQAASKFCQRAGLGFRVVTEEDLWHQGGKR
jgi:hypothetical protein